MHAQNWHLPSDANRNVVLARLVASFLLLCTTSCDVPCSKFSGVWETLWIFKVARWIHNGCMKINKSPAVSIATGASSFKIHTANFAKSPTLGTLTLTEFRLWRCQLKFCQVGYPVGTLTKSAIQMRTFWILSMLLSEKKKEKTKPVGYTSTMYLQTEKNWKWTESFMFVIDFEILHQDHLTQLLPLAQHFTEKGVAAGLGPTGVTQLLTASALTLCYQLSFSTEIPVKSIPTTEPEQAVQLNYGLKKPRLGVDIKTSQ